MDESMDKDKEKSGTDRKVGIIGHPRCILHGHQTTFKRLLMTESGEVGASSLELRYIA